MKTLSQKGAQILSVSDEYVSPWMTLLGKNVRIKPDSPVETYYSISQRDYVGIFAIDQNGMIPLVRQYRPAVEAYTLELPAGTVDHLEGPEEACRRELREETGLVAENIIFLGSYYPDTGRLNNAMHAFLVEAKQVVDDFKVDDELELLFVSRSELVEKVIKQEFRHFLHIGILTLVEMNRPGWLGLQAQLSPGLIE